MKRNLIRYIIAPLIATLVWAVASWGPVETAYKAPAVSTPLRSDITTLVQTRLHQFGYTIKIDGLYGNQTRRVVASWQKANGLQVDGLAGPATLKTLGPISFAAATHPAVRSSPPTPVPSAGSESVEAIIREVWPDDLEDWAVRIAYRESRLQPTAHNSCCYGIFSIYFQVHQGWLADYGVYQPSDLYNPETNARVALALYQQTGPSPWSL